MEGIFSHIFGIAVSIILLIPFGIALLYFIVSLRQITIGSNEHSRIKLKGGLTALIVSGIAIIIILLLLAGIWLF